MTARHLSFFLHANSCGHVYVNNVHARTHSLHLFIIFIYIYTCIKHTIRMYIRTRRWACMRVGYARLCRILCLGLLFFFSRHTSPENPFNNLAESTAPLTVRYTIHVRAWSRYRKRNTLHRTTHCTAVNSFTCHCYYRCYWY